MLDNPNLQRTKKLSKSGQFKVKITQDVIKKDISLYGRLTNYLKSQTLSYSYKKINRNSCCYIQRAWKNKYGSYSNSNNYFLLFKLFDRNIKNQKGTMIYFHQLSLLNVTRLLHREKFLKPEKSFAVFYGQPNILLLFFALQVSNKDQWYQFFSRKTEIYR